jgi:hypothetical protein
MFPISFKSGIVGLRVFNIRQRGEASSAIIPIKHGSSFWGLSIVMYMSKKRIPDP